MRRFIAFDKLALDPGKIKQDDDDILVIEAVLASEIVHRYDDGWAYKPAGELEKAAWTLDGRWISLLGHPLEGYIQRVNDVSGQIHNPHYVKNLRDPKTGRPNRRGIVGDIHFFKHSRNKPGATPVSTEILGKIRNGELNNVSVGFSYQKDETKGIWRGSHYDYIQRGFFFDHVAAPVAVGRCPTPYCGLGMDQVGQVLIGMDPWEVTEEYIRSGHVSPGRFDPNSLRTISISGGVKAVVGCPKGKYENGKCSVGMEIQSYLFSKSNFTVEQAKAWFNKHKGDQIMDQMTIEEIESKIRELEDEKRKLHEKIDKHYASQEASSELEEARSRIFTIENEIRAFQEAKVNKMVEDQEGKRKAGCICPECGHVVENPEGPCKELKCPECDHEMRKREAGEAGDCPICEQIKAVGVYDFARRLVRTFGKDIAFSILLNADETKEEFMEQCLKSKTMEQCVAEWNESHPESDQQTREQFIEECVATGKTQEECEAQWKLQHPEGDEATEEQIEAMNTRCGKYPVSPHVEQGGHVTKPSEYESIPEDSFGDPCNYKYPMDDEHVVAGWAYVSKPENREKGGYSEEEWTWIRNRVRKRMEAAGHEVEESTDALIADSKALIKRLNRYV